MENKNKFDFKIMQNRFLEALKKDNTDEMRAIIEQILEADPTTSLIHEYDDVLFQWFAISHNINILENLIKLTLDPEQRERMIRSNNDTPFKNAINEVLESHKDSAKKVIQFILKYSQESKKLLTWYYNIWHHPYDPFDQGYYIRTPYNYNMLSWYYAELTTTLYGTTCNQIDAIIVAKIIPFMITSRDIIGYFENKDFPLEMLAHIFQQMLLQDTTDTKPIALIIRHMNIYSYIIKLYVKDSEEHLNFTQKSKTIISEFPDFMRSLAHGFLRSKDLLLEVTHKSEINEGSPNRMI